MVEKKLGGAGLRGQSAGETALCTVGKEGAGLTYRGYTIEDLAANAQFEEVAYMLLYGALPTQGELDSYNQKLMSLRGLPEDLKKTLEMIPADTHPMDVMRTGCSMLGNLNPKRISTSSMRLLIGCWQHCPQSSAIGIATAMMASASTRILAKQHWVATF